MTTVNNDVFTVIEIEADHSDSGDAEWQISDEEGLLCICFSEKNATFTLTALFNEFSRRAELAIEDRLGIEWKQDFSFTPSSRRHFVIIDRRELIAYEDGRWLLSSEGRRVKEGTEKTCRAAKVAVMSAYAEYMGIN